VKDIWIRNNSHWFLFSEPWTKSPRKARGYMRKFQNGSEQS